MDAGHKYADDALGKIAEQITEDLEQIGKVVVRKIEKYLKKHKKFIDEVSQKADDGEITEQEYQQQMILKLTTGKEWKKTRDEVAEDMSNGQEDAIKAAGVVLASVYLYNRNYTNDRIEKAVKAKRNKTVKLPRFKKHDPIMPIKLNRKKNYRWHRLKVETVVRRGMKKGESIEEIAKRVREVTNMDKHSAIRTARTCVTSAENSARIQSFADAEAAGIKMEKRWYATKDSRTRSNHRAIDGEVVHWKEYFSNGLFYPGDPYGAPQEVYNCRCTLLGVPDGIDLLDLPDSPAGMGRYEWVGEKPIPKHYGETKKQYQKRVRKMKGAQQWKL